MSATKLETEWSKEFPQVDGVYWWRMDANDTPDAVLVHGGLVYDYGYSEGKLLTEYGGEFLGPLSPADAAQLVRLREAAKAALTFAERIRQHSDHPNTEAAADKVIADVREVIGTQGTEDGE